MDSVLALLPIRIPRHQIDGAVVELVCHDNGTITADIRIPGPATMGDA